MKKLPILFNLFLMLGILAGCGSDDQPEPTSTSLNIPTQFALTDNGNLGNSTDLYLTFKNLPVETRVEDYNLILAKVGSAVPTVEFAQTLDDSRFGIITKTGFPFSGQVNIAFQDTDGNPITNDQAYKAYLFTRTNSTEHTGSLSNAVNIELKDEPYYEVKTLSSTTGEALSYHPDGYLILPGQQNSLYKVGTSVASSEVFDAGLPWPLGGGFDLSTDTYYASYYSSGQVYGYDQNGQKSLVASGLAGPTGIAVDKDHNIYVANYDGSYISKITPQGSNSAFATDQSLINGPDGLVFAEDELYSINFNDSRILKISSTGSVSLFTRLPGTTTGYIAYQDGHFYAAGISTRQIYKIDMSGNFEVIAGTGQSGEIDGPASISRFATPNGIAIAGDTIFVSDASAIRMVIRHD